MIVSSFPDHFPLLFPFLRRVPCPRQANNKSELNNWLINAFNGEWLRTANASPLQLDSLSDKRDLILS
jgi:hypothetical protein